jgi:hypothetical protein
MFSVIVNVNLSHTVFLDTPLHVDTATDTSKLPWHKYVKGKQSKTSHPFNPPSSLSPAVDYMKLVTELMAGLIHTFYVKYWKRWLEEAGGSYVRDGGEGCQLNQTTIR